MRTRVIVTGFILCSVSLPAADHRLRATPETTTWGYFSADSKPVLTVKSGDTVEIQSPWGSPDLLEKAGVAPAQIQPELRAIAAMKDRGPGPHNLTGPVAIEGAQPGDVLEVRIKDVRLDVPYAWNRFMPGAGFLPDDFPEPAVKIIPFDLARKVGKFGPGIEIPLRPFFGTMGVAPAPSAGKVNSLPPGMHGGNMDNKHLVAGTTLYLPVNAAGALFACGDGHAAQGNGEVDITALETSLTGVFQFIVRHDLHFTVPRAETPTHYIAMGLDADLTAASRMATRQAIEFLVSEQGMTRGDAYMLVSTAVDLEITQLVDGTKGVHAMIPKSLFLNSRKAAK
jgi:acetamidase/formamidase